VKKAGEVISNELSKGDKEDKGGKRKEGKIGHLKDSKKEKVRINLYVVLYTKTSRDRKRAGRKGEGRTGWGGKGVETPLHKGGKLDCGMRRTQSTTKREKKMSQGGKERRPKDGGDLVMKKGVVGRYKLGKGFPRGGYRCNKKRGVET